MFEGLGGLGNMASMLKQATQLKEKMAGVQAELANEEVTASTGGGMVTVTMNGNQEVKAVKIDPAVVDPNDLAMLEDLIAAACNEAKKRAQEVAQNKMGAIIGGLGIDPSQIPGMGS